MSTAPCLISRFEDSELIWAPFMPDINTGPEVFVAQANFIPGGCILTSGMCSTPRSELSGPGGTTGDDEPLSICKAQQ
jgi:hypothetical protein